MNNNIMEDIKCPFCTGTGEYKFSQIKAECLYEKEIIAKFLKSKGMKIAEIKKWMGYRSDSSIARLLHAGTAIEV